MTNHEQAAFKGASSMPTPEQVAAQPWRYPKGRIPAEADDLWEPLTEREHVVFFAKWIGYAMAAVASITVLMWVFAS